MPRVPIATENRTGEGGDRFPRIKLQEKGEKKRFTVIELPWREYVHFLKSPTFDEHGRPVKETKYKRNGDPYEDYKLTFEGSPICLGTEEVLKEKGLDEANCPACEASVKSGGDIPGPVQRFSVNVIEYALKGNTWDIKKPFSAEIKIWSFTGRIYDEIEGIQQEIGDLRKHDLTLECEDPYWQRNKLAFKMEPGYTFGDKDYIKELLTTPGNKASEQQLKDACGRDVPRQRMEDDCAHVLRQWRKLRNEGSGDGYDTGTAADLSGGIDDLLSDEGGSDAKPEGNALTGGGDDPFAEFSEEATSNPSPQAAAKQDTASATETTTSKSPEQPAEETALPSEDADPTPPSSATSNGKSEPSAESASGDDFDFDDLMSGIG